MLIKYLILQAIPVNIHAFDGWIVKLKKLDHPGFRGDTCACSQNRLFPYGF
jgi:hypothetical protein